MHLALSSWTAAFCRQQYIFNPEQWQRLTFTFGLACAHLLATRRGHSGRSAQPLQNLTCIGSEATDGLDEGVVNVPIIFLAEKLRHHYHVVMLDVRHVAAGSRDLENIWRG